MDLAETLIRISDKKLKPEFSPAQAGDIRESYADITKAKKILGWEPKVSFDQLVDMMVAWDLELARKEKTLVDAGFSRTNTERIS